ncbi:phage/plasmid primase, P4 family [Mycobacterium sherrisii]|uniref:DNA primase family protein n=1 Tax=Mycobacterium sherrisii TaxID=243061 RepID=UPI00397503CF
MTRPGIWKPNVTLIPDGSAHVALTDVLTALGWRADEHVSLNNKVNDGDMASEIHTASNGLNAAAAELPGNVWFGLNPVNLPVGGSGRRGNANEVTRIVGLPADLDVKNGACPDLDTAWAIIADVAVVVGTRPAVVIHSGKGLQPIWALADGHGVQGRAILRRFGRLVQSCARRRKVKVDSVFDPPRILRVPGTLNYKYDPPLSASAVIDDNGRPLTTAELDEKLKATGVYEYESDRDEDTGTVLSERSTWTYGDSECSYTKKTIEGWETDQPDNGRHPLLINHLVRLACMWRFGCVSSADELDRLYKIIVRRHRKLCASTEPVRSVGRHEVRCAWAWAVEHVSKKTHKQVATELGSHRHLYPTPNQVRKMARRILADLAKDGEPLRFWIGTDDSPTASSLAVQWNGRNRYLYRTAKDVEDHVWDVLEEAEYNKWDKTTGEWVATPWPQTVGSVSAITRAMHGVAKMQAGMTPNSWVARESRGLVIPFQNVLFNPDDKTTQDHSPKFFNLTCLPFDYDSQAGCLAWERTLGQWWPNDPEAVQLLQEWFGYLVSGRTDLHKMLFIRGRTRSGKGTIERLLEQLLGKEAVGSLVMSNLVGDKGRFALQTHLHRSLIVFPDVRQLSANEGAAFVQFALSITGEDPMQVDIKNQPPWVGTLPGRLMVMANETTSMPDASGAMDARLLTLQMSKSFKGKEDTGLQGKLAKELPGILNWALEGLERLNARGHFVQPESGLAVKAEIDERSNPINTFIDQCVIADGRCRTLLELTFNRWRQFCETNGERPGTSRDFRERLRAAMEDKHPEIPYKYDRIDNSKAKHRPYYLFGVGLRGHKVKKRVVAQGKANEHTLLITSPELTTAAGVKSEERHEF